MNKIYYPEFVYAEETEEKTEILKAIKESIEELDLEIFAILPHLLKKIVLCA